MEEGASAVRWAGEESGTLPLERRWGCEPGLRKEIFRMAVSWDVVSRPGFAGPSSSHSPDLTVDTGSTCAGLHATGGDSSLCCSDAVLVSVFNGALAVTCRCRASSSSVLAVAVPRSTAPRRTDQAALFFSLALMARMPPLSAFCAPLVPPGGGTTAGDSAGVPPTLNGATAGLPLCRAVMMVRSAVIVGGCSSSFETPLEGLGLAGWRAASSIMGARASPPITIIHWSQWISPCVNFQKQPERITRSLPETNVMARALRVVDASSGRALTVQRGATDQASQDVIDPVTIRVFQAFLAGLRADLPDVEAWVAPSSHVAMLADELGDEQSQSTMDHCRERLPVHGASHQPRLALALSRFKRGDEVVCMVCRRLEDMDAAVNPGDFGVVIWAQEVFVRVRFTCGELDLEAQKEVRKVVFQDMLRLDQMRRAATELVRHATPRVGRDEAGRDAIVISDIETHELQSHLLALKWPPSGVTTALRAQVHGELSRILSAGDECALSALRESYKRETRIAGADEATAAIEVVGLKPEEFNKPAPRESILKRITRSFSRKSPGSLKAPLA